MCIIINDTFCMLFNVMVMALDVEVDIFDNFKTNRKNICHMHFKLNLNIFLICLTQ